MNNQADDSKLDQPESGQADEQAAEEMADGTDVIDTLTAKAEENYNLYLRAAAELDNVRKRASRDVEHARKYALESFSRDLLSVVDSFEMGLAAADKADAATLREGSEATLKQLLATLERFGVSQISAEGEPFDPELHEAISMQPSTDLEPNSVLADVQSGYTLNGRLLRPARVVVSTAATKSEDSSS